MRLHSRSTHRRARAVASTLALAVSLATVPALLSPAGAVSSPAAASTASARCNAATTALQHAKHQQAAARLAVVKARKALKKANRHHHAARIAKAKRALATANSRYRTATNSVKYRQSQARYDCASPTSTTHATGTGEKLGVLALAKGFSAGPINLGQLTTILDQLLPGVTDHLDPSQLTALLSGFNAGAGGLDPTEALALLSGGFSPTQITGLLGGTAGSDVLTGLVGDIIGQLGGLGGGLPIPGGFDPTTLWNTFAGMFGNLNPSQLGSLLGLLATGFGKGGTTFSPTQLTNMLNGLVPGAASGFNPSQLTSMLGALNGGGLDASTLANLLGGQFSPAQLTSVLTGTAGTALLGNVIAQVMAQLAAAGGGGLALPGGLDTTALTGLVSTLTGLFAGLTGGGVLPSLCSIVPIPLVCP